MSSLLLVDADEGFRDELATVLEALGHIVLQADGPEQAREMLEHAVLDAAVVDCEIEGTSGIDYAAGLLRERPELQLVFLCRRDGNQASHTRLARDMGAR
ncbi:MAG: response regulator, partial [Deltaproteobacteria bacterium]|nr:response regulator [Deltaproteobacteria bacterium]